MGSKRRSRQAVYEEPVRGRDRSERWEEKRRRFAEEDQRGPKPRGATFYVTIGAILLGVLFVGFMTLRTTNANTGGSGGVLQQVAASTASTESGRVGITIAEVQQRKLVYWDYKNASTGKTTPLIAYVSPSGAMKVAVRICEPCNGYSFRVEGNQMVCNVCGTRWDLESLKGVSGGCQGYPPDLLPSTVADGKITVDEAQVQAWKVRI